MSDPATNAPYGSPLTTRELQALRARDNADTDEEAAQRLGISVHTMRCHLANARSRLGVRTTHRAIRIAVRKKAA